MNHLFIGLGEAGEKIVNSLYGRYLYRLHNQLSSKSHEKNKAVERLLIIPKLSLSTEITEHKNKSNDNNDPYSLLSLQSLNEFVKHPERYPAAQALITNDSESWRAILDSFPSINSGHDQKTTLSLENNKRRIGRLLYALSHHDIISKLDTLVQQLKNKNNDSETSFHIVSSLTDTIASGVLIDLLFQLRKTYPKVDNTNHTIINYAYIPNDKRTGWSTHNQQANAYATLLELNAMANSSWIPFDVTKEHPDLTQQKSIDQSVFDSCYIFSDEQETSHQILKNIDSQQHKLTTIETDLPILVADFMLHKSIMTQKNQWQGLQIAEQNLESKRANQNTVNTTSSTELPHAINFINFGINRFEFPRKRFHKILALDLELQLLEQLRYNHLSQDKGYLNKPKQDDSNTFIQFINDDVLLEKWKLSDSYLILEKPLLPTQLNEKWLLHDSTWMALARNYRLLAEQNNPKNWTDEFIWLMDNCNEQQYRNMGVEPFFEQMQSQVDSYAQIIAQIIEEDLLASCLKGQLALSECGQIISALRINIEARSDKANSAVRQYKNKAYQYYQRFLAKKEQIDSAYSYFFLSNNTDEASEELFINLQGHYASITYMNAYHFSYQVLQALSPMLTKLYDTFQTAVILLGSLINMTEKEYQKQNPNNITNPKHIHTFGGVELIQKLRKSLIYDQTMRKNTLHSVRQLVLNDVGNLTLNEWVTQASEDLQQVYRLLSHSCLSAIQDTHNNHLNHPEERFLDISILDKLIQSASKQADKEDKISLEITKKDGDKPLHIQREALNRFTLNMLNQSKSLTKLSTVERNRPHSTAISNHTAVYMPMTAGYEQQITQIQSAFSDSHQLVAACSSSVINDLAFIETPDNDNSITVVSINHNIPLRYFQIVSELKQKYDQRTAYNVNHIASEFHIEGDGSQFHGLFITPKGKINPDAFPLVLLAIHSGLIIKETQLNTDETQWYQYQLTKQVGLVNSQQQPLYLGDNLFSILTNIDEQQMSSLKTNLRIHLSNKIPYSQNELEDMLQELHQTFSEIRQHINTRNPKQTNMLSSSWHTAIKQSIQIARGQIEI